MVESLDGEYLYNGYTVFESVDYGRITQKKIVLICKEVFGAKASRNRRDNRGLTFDKKRLAQLSNLYNLSLEIHVTDVTHVTGPQDVGLDKHLSNDSINEKNTELEQKNDEISDEIDLLHSSEALEIDKTDPSNPENVSHPSHASPDDTLCTKIGDTFYGKIDNPSHPSLTPKAEDKGPDGGGAE